MARFGAALRRVVLAAAGTLPVLVHIAPASASFKYLKPGMEASDFALKTLEDRQITLADLKQSTASLLVFWATWSPKSEPALTEAKALSERHGNSGLRLVAVNLDRPEIGLKERALIEKTAHDLGLIGSVALDPGFATASAMGVVANPAMALFDSRGVLVWDASGWSRGVQEQLRSSVESLLGVGGDKPTAAAPPGHAPAHKALLSYNLGRTFLRQGNLAKAQSLFETAADADPAWAAPRAILGHLLLRSGTAADLAQAEVQFRAAVAADPGDVSALAGLGETLLRANRVEEAAPFLEKALALDATFTPAVAGRAQALARQGRQAEALALFEAALDLNPRDAEIYAGRASCRELAGDHGAAAADYRKAVEIFFGAR